MCTPKSSPKPCGLQTERLQRAMNTLEVAKTTATLMEQQLLEVDGPHAPSPLSNRIGQKHGSSSSAVVTSDSSTARNDINENCHYRQQGRWDITTTVILKSSSTNYVLHLLGVLWDKIHPMLQAELCVHSSFWLTAETSLTPKEITDWESHYPTPIRVKITNNKLS